MTRHIAAGALACLFLANAAPAQALQSVVRLTECACGEDSQCYLAGVPVGGDKELVVLMNYDVYERLCEKPSSQRLATGGVYAVTYRKETFEEEGGGGTYEAFGLVKIERRRPPERALGKAPAPDSRGGGPRQAEAFMEGLVHLRATGTEVRLRTGPGTSHKVLRKVGTSEGAAPNDELVALRETVTGDGMEWYHVLYVPAWREAEGYMPTDAWICADFVKASGLTPADRQAVLLDRFGTARAGTPRQDAPGAMPPLWRTADRSRMIYVGFAGDVVLRREVAILPSEQVMEDVTETFRITRRDGASFCARNQEDSFYVDSRERLVRLDGWNIDELCGTVSGGRLTLKDGTKLAAFGGELGRTFPESLLKRSAGR